MGAGKFAGVHTTWKPVYRNGLNSVGTIWYYSLTVLM